MIPYLLGIVTGILLSILNLIVVKFSKPKEIRKSFNKVFNKKASIVDMTPDIDLGE